MKKSIVFLVLLVAISILAVFLPAVPGTIITEGKAGDLVPKGPRLQLFNIIVPAILETIKLHGGILKEGVLTVI